MQVHSYNRASIEHPERCEDAIAEMRSEGHAPVFVVIDGMGGHQHQGKDGVMVTGRDAALLVRETLIEDLSALPLDIDASAEGLAQERVTAAIARAHQRVRDELNLGGTLPRHECVGAVCTVVALCENGARLLAVQVGDTRGYLLTDGELIQLCPDEDNVEYFVRQGLLKDKDGARITAILNAYDGVHEPKAEGTVTIADNTYDLYIAWRWFMNGNSVLNIPAANIVINAAGVDSATPVPQSSRIERSPGDLLLLASDGLYKNLTDDELMQMLPGPGDTATTMGDAAYARSQDRSNQRSTQDDISAVVVNFDAE